MGGRVVYRCVLCYHGCEYLISFMHEGCFPLLRLHNKFVHLFFSVLPQASTAQRYRRAPVNVRQILQAQPH